MSDAPKNRVELIKAMARRRLGHNLDMLELDSQRHWLNEASKYLEAIEAAGCVVVPREATEDMILTALNRTAFQSHSPSYRAIHRAMTAASPFAPEDK
jgi:tRNA splicing ligase